jgi:hypothetical protein
MSNSKNPLWHYLEDGNITTTQYIAVPVSKGAVGCYVAWIDATSNAAITLELTSFPSEEAVTTTAGTYQWKDSGLTFTGPAGSAAGSLLINVENVRQSRARLKVVASATTKLVIYNGDQPL